MMLPSTKPEQIKKLEDDIKKKIANEIFMKQPDHIKQKAVETVLNDPNKFNEAPEFVKIETFLRVVGPKTKNVHAQDAWNQVPKLTNASILKDSSEFTWPSCTLKEPYTNLKFVQNLKPKIKIYKNSWNHSYIGTVNSQNKPHGVGRIVDEYGFMYEGQLRNGQFYGFVREIGKTVRVGRFMGGLYTSYKEYSKGGKLLRVCDETGKVIQKNKSK